MINDALRVGLVGPLPPPSGGMANQTQMLADQMQHDGNNVTIVQTNAPYQPQFITHIPVLRALFRLIPYQFKLMRMCKRVDVVHVMANSGWSWHLFVTPCVWIAKLFKKPVVVNYHGGEAEAFFDKSINVVRPTMKTCAKIIVPTKFLEKVFAKYNIDTQIVPNTIDLSVFNPKQTALDDDKLNILIARNLELIYDNETAIRAFHLVHENYPCARLTIAGTGPERNNLEQLVNQLNLSTAVEFVGRVDRHTMAELFKQSHVMINPSTADNMPISILESLASGVPVVTTNVGGIPYLVENETTALMVDARDYEAISAAISRLVQDPSLRAKLINNGIQLVKNYAWSSVKGQWQTVYRNSMARVN